MEDTLDALVLPAFKTDGHIIKDYALSRKGSNPDFWVLDGRRREWLVECVNEAHHTYEPGLHKKHVKDGETGKHRVTYEYMTNKIEWKHGLSSTGTTIRILTKNWTSPVYYVKQPSGVKHRIPVTVDNATPLLVISYFDFDEQASAMLYRMFGENIVTIGEQLTNVGYPGPAFLKIWRKLLEVFAR